MERDKKLENFINNWNGDFPNYELKGSDLREPQALMGALVQVFDRLGIDRAVLAEAPEDNVNDSMPYYRDLLPVINVTRVVNYLVSMMPQVATISVTHFLHPTVMTSHSILLLIFNLMVFYEDKLREIAPCEEELFEKSEQVNRLVEQKHKLQEMLNEQAQEKALRAERLEKLERDTKRLEEELKEEAAAHNAELAAVDEARQRGLRAAAQVEQRGAARGAAAAERGRLRARRVLDAADVRDQAAAAARGVRSLEAQFVAARGTLLQKEASLRNLQALKPNFDAANAVLRDITALSETLTDMEGGDLETDSQEGELDVVFTELSELQAAGRELRAAREDLAARRRAAAARRARDTQDRESALREAAEKFRKDSARCELAARRVEELQSTEEMLMKVMVDLVKQVSNN